MQLNLRYDSPERFTALILLVAAFNGKALLHEAKTTSGVYISRDRSYIEVPVEIPERHAAAFRQQAEFLRLIEKPTQHENDQG